MHESEDRPAVSPAITPSRHLPAHPRGRLTWHVSSEVWRGSKRKNRSGPFTPRKEVGRTAIETEQAYDQGRVAGTGKVPATRVTAEREAPAVPGHRANVRVEPHAAPRMIAQTSVPCSAPRPGESFPGPAGGRGSIRWGVRFAPRPLRARGSGTNQEWIQCLKQFSTTPSGRSFARGKAGCGHGRRGRGGPGRRQR